MRGLIVFRADLAKWHDHPSLILSGFTHPKADDQDIRWLRAPGLPFLLQKMILIKSRAKICQ